MYTAHPTHGAGTRPNRTQPPTAARKTTLNAGRCVRHPREGRGGNRQPPPPKKTEGGGGGGRKNSPQPPNRPPTPPEAAKPPTQKAPKTGPQKRHRGTDAFPWGAWPRDAAVDTHKQAGRQSTALTGASSRSCHVTKRFRILATLKQGNKSMYSNTSGYVHIGLGLDWAKGITGQETLSPDSYRDPRFDPPSGWEGRGLKHNRCPTQSGP